jgi:chaperonin cofactor prefoldin
MSLERASQNPAEKWERIGREEAVIKKEKDLENLQQLERRVQTLESQVHKVRTRLAALES